MYRKGFKLYNVNFHVSYFSITRGIFQVEFSLRYIFFAINLLVD